MQLLDLPLAGVLVVDAEPRVEGPRRVVQQLILHMLDHLGTVEYSGGCCVVRWQYCQRAEEWIYGLMLRQCSQDDQIDKKSAFVMRADLIHV